MDKTPSKQQYGLGRVAFKVHLVDIQQEIEAGYTLAMIYEKRKDSLGISYSQFARHVQRYIRQEVPSKIPQNTEAFSPEKTASVSHKPFTSRFEFNPVAPDYNDLI